MRVGMNDFSFGKFEESVRPGPERQKRLIGVRDNRRARLQDVIEQKRHKSNFPQNCLGF